MLTDKLNNLVGDLSSLLKTHDMATIGTRCMQVANYSRIDQYEGDIDCAIDRKLTEIALEPLNDKLSLNPRIFAAQNRILSRRLEVENLERYHSETRETR